MSSANRETPGEYSDRHLGLDRGAAEGWRRGDPNDLLIIAVAQFHHAPIIHFDRHFDLYYASQN